jgi:hypothetical protein
MNFSADPAGDLALLGGAAGGYGILPAAQVAPTYLLALLNSSLLEWLLRPPGFSSPFRGGWFSCEARFINLLPIKHAKKVDAKALQELADRAIILHEKLWISATEQQQEIVSRQVEAIEGEIDERVFSLYGVTAVEQKEIGKLVDEMRTRTGDIEVGVDEPVAPAPD